jgi:hypothetical protein
MSIANTMWRSQDDPPQPAPPTGNRQVRIVSSVMVRHMELLASSLTGQDRRQCVGVWREVRPRRRRWSLPARQCQYRLRQCAGVVPGHAVGHRPGGRHTGTSYGRGGRRPEGSVSKRTARAASSAPPIIPVGASLHRPDAFGRGYGGVNGSASQLADPGAQHGDPAAPAPPPIRAPTMASLAVSGQGCSNRG